MKKTLEQRALTALELMTLAFGSGVQAFTPQADALAQAYGVINENLQRDVLHTAGLHRDQIVEWLDEHVGDQIVVNLSSVSTDLNGLTNILRGKLATYYAGQYHIVTKDPYSVTGLYSRPLFIPDMVSLCAE